MRGRLGYAPGNFMPYVTGGSPSATSSLRSPASATDETKAGWTAGGGIEAMISGTVERQARISLCRSRPRRLTLGSDAKFKTNIVRAGLNYKF